MNLHNEFEVGAAIETAWTLLTDLERIAPCLPGAQLESVEGDEYSGHVKVKVGPITAQYRGVARFVERDDTARRAVISANGRDTRGQGNATATITATATSLSSDRTRISIDTDLLVTGKVAQFGRGVMADVSAKLLGQFVDNLERTVLPSATGPAASGGPVTDDAAVAASASGTPVGEHAEVEPIDLLAAAGIPTGRKAAAISLTALVALLLLWRLMSGDSASV